MENQTMFIFDDGYVDDDDDDDDDDDNMIGLFQN
jgi:hypothetical protein